jgi:hypothetical protein
LGAGAGARGAARGRGPKGAKQAGYGVLGSHDGPPTSGCSRSP